MLELIEKGLACWRLSYMFVNEDGPFKMFHYFRQLTGIEYNEQGAMSRWNPLNPLVCLYCTSVWIAPLLFVLPRVVSQVFAVSAIAVLIDKNSK